MFSEKFYLGLGDCSAPLIPHNSHIRVVHTSVSEIMPGDIALYCGYKAIICHRVVLKKKTENLTWILTKPDNTLVDDGWIPEYRVIGKVVSINDRPFSRTSPLSLLLLIRAFFQYTLFHYFFLSNLGISLKKIYIKFYDKPILSTFMLKLSSPWLWRKSC